MSQLGPLTQLEQLFVELAPERLPVGGSRIIRNEHGILCYNWPSPCSEVGELWVIVESDQITLSTRITHIHIDRFALRPEIEPDTVDEYQIVEKAIEVISDILTGAVTFCRSYDGDGREHSTGTSRMAALDDELAEYRKIFGDAMTQRSWNWFGEVS